MDSNPYAPPKAVVADVVPSTTDASPALWNPGAAAKWSLVFTPVFGAAVQMKNWQAMGEPEKAAQSKQWLIGSVAFIAVLVVLGMFVPDSKGVDGAFRGAGLGFLVVWYMMNGKVQVQHVTSRFGTAYPRRGWARPLLYGVLGYAGFFVAAVLIGFVIGALTG